ncbi:hypothetical protein TNCV_4483841 [Trichonephila clavipes]|nr:hypothetical protein TNCV_4483841 [Trichonephila clavipes]
MYVTTVKAHCPPVRLVFRRGQCHLRCHPRHLTMVKMYEGRREQDEGEHDISAAKTTKHDISDATEIDSAAPHTLVVENQHINLPEEPELMANTDSDAPKKHVSVFFYFKPLPKATQCEKKEKAK